MGSYSFPVQSSGSLRKWGECYWDFISQMHWESECENVLIQQKKVEMFHSEAASHQTPKGWQDQGQNLSEMF